MNAPRPTEFVVKDEVETSQPQTVTAFLHADNVINNLSDKMFVFEPTGTSLSAEIAALKMFDAKIEKNILTAPGRPGSVDKGEREMRDWRLAISTKEKTNKLKWKRGLKSIANKFMMTGQS